jgi:rRNA processing protein Gar1
MAEFGFNTNGGGLVVGAEIISVENAIVLTEVPPLEVENLSPEVVPLPEIVTAADFDIHTGDYPLLDTKHWEPERYKIWGEWVIRVLSDAPAPTPFQRHHALRLRAMGLGPVVKRLGEFGTFRDRLDLDAIPKGAEHWRNTARARPEYYNWPDEKFVRFAIRVQAKLGHRPRAHDYIAYASDTDPGIHAIKTRFGGVPGLNELIGYPNYAEWKPRDFVTFGVNFIKANGYNVDRLVPDVFEIVSAKQRGPWPAKAGRAFGNWANYKIAVLRAYYAEREQKTNRYKRLIDSGDLPVALAAADSASLDRNVARYAVISILDRDMPAEERAQLALTEEPSLLKVFKKRRIIVTEQAVESAAAKAGVYDDIFPPSYMPYITVSPEEITETVRLSNEINVRAYTRSREKGQNS